MVTCSFFQFGDVGLSPQPKIWLLCQVSLTTATHLPLNNYISGNLLNYHIYQEPYLWFLKKTGTKQNINLPFIIIPSNDLVYLPFILKWDSSFCQDFMLVSIFYGPFFSRPFPRPCKSKREKLPCLTSTSDVKSYRSSKKLWSPALSSSGLKKKIVYSD